MNFRLIAVIATLIVPLSGTPSIAGGLFGHGFLSILKHKFPEPPLPTGTTCSSPVVGDWRLDQPLILGSTCTVRFENGAEFPGVVSA